MGLDFNFGNDDYPDLEPSEETDQVYNPLDALVEAAGGKALPGKWGLAQAMLSIWTTECHGHPALWVAKNGLNTIGAFRSYQKAMKPKGKFKYVDPIEEWFKQREIIKIRELTPIAEMIHGYSLATELPCEKFFVHKKTDKDIIDDHIQAFALPSGVRYYFVAHKVYTGHDRSWAHRGPYMKETDIEQFEKEISAIIWKANGDHDLQLTMHNEDGRRVFRLENIGAPNDFISGEGTWENLDKLSSRIDKLHKQGVSRNILFYGPPGVGKSSLSRNLAKRVGGGNALRIEIRVLSYVGIKDMMTFVRLLRPNVLLFDDIDRDLSEVIEFLHLFEQSSNDTSGVWVDNMVTIATVNSVTDIDPALLRPGRFDEVVEVLEPDMLHRSRIIDHYLQKLNVDLSKDRLTTLVEETDGFSGADIREVIQCVAAVGEEHLEDEIMRVARQRAHYGGDAYENFINRHRKGGRLAPSEKHASRLIPIV